MILVMPKSGSILGVGCDLVEVERIKKVVEKQGDIFVERVFTAEERAYCFRMKNPYTHLAARFAAKEAVAKAFTTGIGEDLSWKSISVGRGTRGQPLIKLDKQGQALLKEIGGAGIHISLSHTTTMAMAVAAIFRPENETEKDRLTRTPFALGKIPKKASKPSDDKPSN